MVFSSLTQRQAISRQSSSRSGTKITSIILHHQASTNYEGVIGMMVSGSRQVSSNYVIGNEGQIVGVVPEELRAWTSGSSSDGGKGAAWDRKSITFEIENSSLGGSWPVSSTAHEATAKVVADIARRYGIKLSRETVVGHRELWTKFGASYPTACPGGLNMDWIVKRANQILADGGTTPVLLPITPSPPSSPDTVEFGEEAGIPAWIGLQNMLKKLYGYSGIIDGIPGKASWSAMQRFLNQNWGYTGAIDGVPGKLSWSATQRWLKTNYEYAGATDGVPGKNTFAALSRAGIAIGKSYGGATSKPKPLPKTTIDGIAGTVTWKRLQTWLKRDWGYVGAIDGIAGPNTWKAFQKYLKKSWGYTGLVDGLPGTKTYSAMQRFARRYGYAGAIDGVPGRNTWKAIQKFANTI
jgi:peptidoglycan hydrolase-like protein with peptidoglycan-binding domain